MARSLLPFALCVFGSCHRERASSTVSLGKRAWKALPWSVMDQLHYKGYISDPATKANSVCLSDEGARLSEELFEKLFVIK